MRKLQLIAAAVGVAALGSTVPAFAGGPGGAVSAVTHSSGHPDTTSNAGPCTDTSANGPVWAYDNLSLRLVSTPESAPDTYSVTIYAHGSFSQIADPNTGACATGHGSVDGWLTFDVSSKTAPDPKALPSQVPGDMSQGAILNQFFDGNATIVGGGHYSYTYNRVDGERYTQGG